MCEAGTDIKLVIIAQASNIMMADYIIMILHLRDISFVYQVGCVQK